MPLSAQQLVEPAYVHFPEWSETYGPEVADLADLAGFAPDPEQEMALNALFGIDSNGKSVAFEFCVICARQNLKTGLFKQAALGWLFITDQELIVWSAHEMDITREAFRDLVALIENTPSLKRRLNPGPTNGIISGPGHEMIELAPTKACPEGQRIKFKARTNSGGRGLTGDKVILDEGYALRPSHMGSLVPAMSARSMVADPQMVIGSSAGHADSDVLRGARDRGRTGKSPRQAYMEFCAPTDSCESEDCTHVLETPGCALDNMELIKLANPAIGRRISEQYILDERQSMPPDEFARERLTWWDAPNLSREPKISDLLWADMRDPNSKPVDPVSFGIYTNKDRTSSAIGVAAYRADGLIHVGIIPARAGEARDSLPGTAWIAARAAELSAKWSPCAMVIDSQNAAASLITAIEESGVSVETTSAQDMARACGNFYDAVTDKTIGPDGQPGRIRHQGSPALAQSVCAGKPRDLGDSWAWDRKDSSSDITQLVAVTLALHGLIVHGRPREIEVWGFMS